MKKSILLIISLFCSFVAYSQANIDEKGFSYQGYARDAEGTPLASETITVRFRIFEKGNSFTATDFEEEHALTTDAFGVFHTVVGSVAPNDYKALNFIGNNYKMTVEAKTGTTNYVIVSDAELLAIPYAKAAEKADYAQAAAKAENGVPPGTVIAFAGQNIPPGYLVCDGESYAKTKYPDLYNALNGIWGNDGTNFNVPDMRGMFIRGVDSGAGNDPDAETRVASRPGGAKGDAVGSVQGEAFKQHNHSASSANEDIVSRTSTNGTTNLAGYTIGAAMGNGTSNASATNNSGPNEINLNTFLPFKDKFGGHNHAITVNNTGAAETRPKNAYMFYIIKY